MSRAQLHKSLKAFGHPPTFEQQSQLIVLQQQFEAAEQNLAQLESAAPPAPAPTVAAVSSTDADLKRAKIQLAMRRAELKKAQANEAPAQQIEALERALGEAERLVDAHASP
jgi:electron transport complex protein RnfB